MLAKFPPGITPSGWLSCNATTALGATSIDVSRSTYSALFTAISTAYGFGDGSTTFGIPAIPETRGTWSATTAFPISNNNLAMVALSDGRVLQVGGQGGMTSTRFGTVSATGISWVSGTNTSFNSISNSVAVLTDGRILNMASLMSGGSVAFGTISSNTITWAAGTATASPVYSTGLVALADGRVFFAGGFISGVDYTATTFFGTIAGNTITWVSGTALPQALSGHTMTLIGTNKVLVVGGQNGTGVSSSVYIGDISGNTVTWRTLSTLIQGPLANHSAALLQDGRVLIIGGNSDGAASGSHNRASLLTIGTYNVDEQFTTPLPTNQMYGAAACLSDGRVLHICGKVTAATSLSYIFSLDRNWIKT
jgi:hypothetical protein